MNLNKYLSLAVAVLGLAFAFGPAAAAGKPDAVDTCATCHGDNGVSSDDDVPTIAGASSFFLENALIIFQEEARPCAAEEFKETDEELPADNHCALASEFSEDQVIALAEYYAGQEFKPADQPVDQALAEQGASIHERSCDRCHAEGGSFKLDDAGILAGQWKPYLIKQMQHFKAGKRWQPEKMEPAMKDLSEEDIKALAEYYAGQGPERFQ